MNGVEKYAFVSFASGGLLLDLDTGALFQLNDSAAFVWQRFLLGQDGAQIAKAVAARYGLDEARARADVGAALAAKRGDDVTSPTDDFWYERSAAGYVQSLNGIPVLEVNSRGERLRALALDGARPPRDLRNCLRGIVPKVLSLRGHTVIHASAVITSNRLLVFAGASGAGKTTTARALVERGARAVCEDKLVVRYEKGRVTAWVNAESSIDAWIKRATSTLLADGECACAELDEAAGGEQISLAEIGFVDAHRRHDGALMARPLNPLDAAAEMFRSTFLGSEEPLYWKRHLESAAAITMCASSYALTMPNNLATLSRAAEALAARGTLAA